ncbi:hypothetical protein Tco_0650731 [Tanacetum coccineum]
MAPKGRPPRTTRSRHVVTTTPPTSLLQLSTCRRPYYHNLGHQCPTTGHDRMRVVQWVLAARAATRMATIAIPRELVQEGMNALLLGVHLSRLHEMSTRILHGYRRSGQLDPVVERNEIHEQIEAELWNLKVQGTDVVAYNQRFQELALLSDRMFPEEADKIERYVGGMPDPIYSSVVASKPKTMQEAIEMATGLMERRINTLAERQTENKRRLEDTPRNNQNQQNKRQNTGRAYAAGNGSHTKGLSLYVSSVMAIMKQVLVHLGAVTAIGLVIWPGTIGYGLLTITTTTVTTTTTTVVTTTIISRAMVALSVELKATLKETARN